MADDIAKTIDDAMARKVQKLEEAEQQRKALVDAREKSREETTNWLKSVVIPLMKEFEAELDAKGISADATFLAREPNYRGLDGPSAQFRIKNTHRSAPSDSSVSVTFKFQDKDKVQVRYAGLGGGRHMRGAPPECRPTWGRDAIKRLIDPVVEDFFNNHWSGDSE